MLSNRESQAGAPREPDVVGSFDSQGVQDRGRVGDPCAQRVGGNIVGLVAAALATVVGEDEAKVLGEGLGEGRGLRVLQWIGEARIDKNRWGATSRILEVGVDVVYGIRREGYALPAPAPL